METIFGMSDLQNREHIGSIINLIDRKSAIEARRIMLTDMVATEFVQDLGKFLGGKLEFRLVFEPDKKGIL